MISLLNKLGRRMVSDRGEKLNNPRLFSSTAKRVLSVLFLLILGFSFLPTFDIDVSAATPGVSNVVIQVRDDGGMDITATVTPKVIGGSVGSAYLYNCYIRSLDGTFVTEMNYVSKTQLSGPTNGRDVTVWKGTIYAPEDGDWNVDVRWYDNTTGVPSWNSNAAGLIRVNGLKYDRTRNVLPSISVPNVTPHASDKTKQQVQMDMRWVGNRRPTNLTLYRGDANGNNGAAIYSITNPNGTYHYYMDSGLKAGTTYSYWATATSGAGTKTSNVYTATPGTPTAPTGIVAVPNSGSVTWTWNEPANKNGSTIASYNIYSGTNVIANVTSRTYSYNGTNGYQISTNLSVAAVTTEGTVGARVGLHAPIVGSPQPVANACCIMHNAYCIMLNAECRVQNGDSSPCGLRMTNSSGGFLLCMSFRAEKFKEVELWRRGISKRIIPSVKTLWFCQLPLQQGEPLRFFTRFARSE